MVVVVGVVHDLHARLVQRLYGLREFIHPIPHQEECGLYIVLGENIDEHLRILVPPR